MTHEDYDQVPGWPQVALAVHRRRSRTLPRFNWRHRKDKPLWFRALKRRGSLR